MGFFGGIKSTFKKSEAAVVIQNLLEHHARIGLLPVPADPAKTANALVQAAWDDMPDVFSGKFGQRPHKLAVAATALGLCVMGIPATHPHRPTLVLCLGTVLSEVQKNGRLYPLNGIDDQLLEAAYTAFMLAQEQPTADDEAADPAHA
ncbi:hypothetical protein LY625_03680 [Lysobacter sp. GX 14042]|uniref:hypothetical protein n=1 Tax=Lysobacter sp. GX 14042 TaxID=2907155 RepID=UPI001F38430A|nr:hypothetical protein [Lysobacter sp. GX 14042]MCE7031725.1 hypothetical protein [Lysobacter sp. GX 14042]